MNSKNNEEITSMSLNECEMKTIDEDDDEDGTISLNEIEKNGVANKIKFKRSSSLDPQQLHGFNPIKRRFSSIMSLGDLIGDAILTDSYGQVKNGKWYSFE